jgi:serine/threonine-protein kinase HipA
MAVSLWGRVYYNDLFAGILRQEPSGRCVFTYDPGYLKRDEFKFVRILSLRSSVCIHLV